MLYMPFYYVFPYILPTLLHATENIEIRKGHLKPFGSINSVLKVGESEGFPDPKTFFHEYVLTKTPVVMRNAAKVSPAFERWTDEYFFAFKESQTHAVNVETMKKENRKQNTQEMTFLEFVSSYNYSGIYMVNPVPKFIR